MPVKHQSAPKLRHHKATGQAAVVLDGKWIYLGKFGSAAAQEHYDRVIAEWLARGRQLVPGTAELAIAELILAYWRFANTYYRKNGRPTDEINGIKAAMRPLKRLYASLPAGQFTPLKLKAVRGAMIDAGHSRKYINDNINRIKRMVRWGVENELIAPAVLHGLQAIGGLRRGRSEARDTNPVRPIDDASVNAVRPHVSKQVWAMIELQRLTGMRSGEVVIMRACDIEMDGAIWIYRPASHKTEHHGHSRVVEPGPKAQAVIRPFLQPELSGYLFSAIDADVERRAELHRHRKTPKSCGNRPGTNRKRSPRRQPQQRYTTASYRRGIQRGIEKAFPHPELSRIRQRDLTPQQRDELKKWRREHHWHPHQLRHSFATRVRKEYGLESAKVLLGQTTIAAAEIYAEADRERAAAIAAKIG